MKHNFVFRMLFTDIYWLSFYFFLLICFFCVRFQCCHFTLCLMCICHIWLKYCCCCCCCWCVEWEVKLFTHAVVCFSKIRVDLWPVVFICLECEIQLSGCTCLSISHVQTYIYMVYSFLDMSVDMLACVHRQLRMYVVMQHYNTTESQMSEYSKHILYMGTVIGANTV